MRFGRFLRCRTQARPEDKPAPASAAAETAVTADTPAPRMTKWGECIRRLLAENGYVIQASPEEMVKGSPARMFGSDQPFRIIGAAEYSDALRQWRIYQELSGENMDPPPPPGANWHYYKFGVRP